MTQARLSLFEGPNRGFQILSRPLPHAVGPGELLVEISLATICGSDLHTVEGRRSQPLPSVLGHEGVGIVRATGLGRNPGLVGTRISWSLADSCGACLPCARWDLPQKCEHLFKYGHAGMTEGSGFNGCLATHIVLRPGTFVVAVPDRVHDPAAVSANCALATVLSAMDSFPKHAETVIVQGAGMLGLHACAVLRQRKVRNILLVDTSVTRLALAHAFSADPLDPVDALARYRGRADAVLELTGSPEAVRDGLKLLRPGGFYALVGMVHPQSALDITGETIVRGCLTLRGVHNYSPQHLSQAMEFLEAEVERYPWPQIVSEPFPLDRIKEAFAEAASRRWHRVAVAPGG